LVICSSTIGMESARNYSASLRISNQYGRSTASGGTTSGLKDGFSQLLQTDVTDQELLETETDASEEVETPKDAMTALSDLFSQVRSVSNHNVKDREDSIEKIKVQCIMYLINLIFHRKTPKEVMEETAYNYQATPSSGSSSMEVGMPVVSSYTQSTMYSRTESESTTFSSQGKVVTADGREISFGIECSMSRSFTESFSQSVQMQTISYVDPLVINLDSEVTQVSDQKFFFDLNSDGIKDEISKLSGKSGYLAYDKNEDGNINDGSELFGTKSGDGFYDLEKYDKDQNGWIDEQDAIFEKLQIWTTNEEGEQVLCDLKDAGVGALCLHKTTTEFALNSQKSNDTNALIRSTGIFLYENGMAGTLQQLDMAT